MQEVGAQTRHLRRKWTHCPSMQRWNQDNQSSDEVENGEERKRQQELHRYSTNKRKTRVSSLLNRDGDEG